MIFGSVCSGIEAASAAWTPLGWKAAWFSEIGSFPSEVLKYHYPDVENLGDMTELYASETFKRKRIDLLVGGTPCQSFSLQGVREGLDDPRGVLALEFLRLAYIKKPRWIVWENVPNVLRVDAGRAFGTILGALVQLGYGFSYRVLDAQFFGVPQIRRRVYIVGHIGDWRPAAAVLFESGCVSGSPEQVGGQAIQSKAQPAPTCSLGEGIEPIISFNHQEGRNFAEREGISNPLILSQTQAVLVPGEKPRRFTPAECEKLMGFPVGYTAIPSEDASASARYKVLGDSMAVPVMSWIGRRIQAVDTPLIENI